VQPQILGFSGIACYEKTVYLDEAPERAVLKAEHVLEMMKVTVNGSEAGVRIFPPYQVEVGGRPESRGKLDRCGGGRHTHAGNAVCPQYIVVEYSNILQACSDFPTALF